MSVFMGTTRIEPAKTIGEISSVLIRAGVKSIATDYEGGRVVAVRFSVQVAGIPEPVFFRLPCREERLLMLLKDDKAQAQRTAWRQVLRWVEAQMAMIDIGMVKMHEVFQPYALAPGTDRTMFDCWEAQMQLALPPAGGAK